MGTIPVATGPLVRQRPLFHVGAGRHTNGGDYRVTLGSSELLTGCGGLRTMPMGATQAANLWLDYSLD